MWKFLFLFFVLIVAASALPKKDDPTKCKGPHEEYRTCGPPPLCDPQVCRGIIPNCDELGLPPCNQGCYCEEGYSRLGDRCVRQCPLFP